ncbi:MAG: hypothetical protein DRN15_05735 [Thermoprotei archaeon]|nr:MAG: hypothetical protein DRN15_05735 [Thermoprotei archaeon]RLF24805.1 MAG: hypothetical protein DRM97_03035 [Thermoprotei archaeon]
MSESRPIVPYRARVKNRQLIIPVWIRELCNWKPNEVLYFKLTETGDAIEVSRADGYTTKMIKSRMHIPVDLARALSLKDGTIVELIPKEGGILIVKPVKE